MKRKGFTLVELLAVIAILAILAIISIPNIMSLFNEAKKNSFTNELKNIYKTANSKWMSDSMFDTSEKTYARCNNGCPNQLSLSGREELHYFIKLNKNGKVVEFYAEDGSYQYSYKGNGLNIEDISDVVQIANITNNRTVTITCNSGKVSSPVPASINNYLMGATILRENTNYLRTDILKKDIEKITFTDSIEGHSTTDANTWDVSYGNNGSVLAWAVDADNNGLYELTIGTNGDVYASQGTFAYLVNLKEISGIQFFNTSMVERMNDMFLNCNSLVSIDLSNFDTSSATSMSCMFYGCSQLTSLDLSSFNTLNVSNMFQMFAGCTNLSNLNLSSFNTSNVTTMNQMFATCSNLKEIDISSFSTNKLTDTYWMFYRCSNLETIYTSNDFSTSLVTSSSSMFSNNSKLVGGSGTTYDSSHTDKEYARIDGGTSSPGYFTLKTN